MVYRNFQSPRPSHEQSGTRYQREQRSLDQGLYKFVITPLLLANAFAFGLSFTEARQTLLAGGDPSQTTPVTVALAMKAMGATYRDTVGLNPKSMGHVLVFAGLGWGDALGKAGAIVVMHGEESVTPDHVARIFFANTPDAEKRRVAASMHYEL